MKRSSLTTLNTSRGDIYTVLILDRLDVLAYLISQTA